jgi:hypothetical protein
MAQWPHQEQIPPVPWKTRSQLTSSDLDEIYTTCIRQDAHHCINNNLLKVVFRSTGRDVRINTVRTENGFLYWTEILSNGVGVKLRAPMVDVKYAKVIDDFDYLGSHFKIPKKCPYGETEFIGPSRTITREERAIKFSTESVSHHTKEPRARQAEKVERRANGRLPL